MSKFADRIMLTGFMVMLLGATGADSPGDGYLIAGAVVLAGCGMMAAGQWMESEQCYKAMKEDYKSNDTRKKHFPYST